MKGCALTLLPALFASVAAWAAPRETVPLDGAWEVRIDPADEAAKAHPKEAQWFPARVPGSVQQDLIAAGRVPDPFKGINEAPIQWAGLTSWQFRRVIDVTPAMLSDPMFRQNPAAYAAAREGAVKSGGNVADADLRASEAASAKLATASDDSRASVARSDASPARRSAAQSARSPTGWPSSSR